MYFNIDESVTVSECYLQYNYNLNQMHKLDERIAELKRTLKTFPPWDSCMAPEDREIVNGLINKIEYLSDTADNYERSVDYWGVQLNYAQKREKENTTCV